MSNQDFTRTLPAKRMGAGVLFFDAMGRLLLVEPTYKREWEIPGGIVETDESPWKACHREIQEELALSRPPGRLLGVDWVPAIGRRTEGLMVVFDGGLLTGLEIDAIALPKEELRGYAFCSVEEAANRVSARMARRLAACAAARDAGTVAYLENGLPVLH